MLLKIINTAVNQGMSIQNNPDCRTRENLRLTILQLFFMGDSPSSYQDGSVTPLDSS